VTNIHIWHDMDMDFDSTSDIDFFPLAAPAMKWFKPRGAACTGRTR
jgi:hypothetical protein